LLTAAVIIIGTMIYYATKPPSADRLYAAVKVAADRGGAEELVAVEHELSRFLETYPNDPRAAELKELQQDLEQYRLDRRVKLHARRSMFDLTPLERAYAEAEQLTSTDPEAALAKFKALIAVYADANQPSDSANQKRTAKELLHLSQRQIDRLRPQVEKMIAQEREAIEAQLKRADALASTDPAAAEQIRRGIITLYGDKAWARQFVKAAEAELDQ
jgi:hypothetical protein